MTAILVGEVWICQFQTLSIICNGQYCSQIHRSQAKRKHGASYYIWLQLFLTIAIDTNLKNITQSKECTKAYSIPNKETVAAYQSSKSFMAHIEVEIN